jgi:hypothetical protein
MPVGSATVTAKTGPATQATSMALSGVTSMVIDIKRQVIQFYQGNELTGPAKEFDLTGVTTLTDTIASTNHAIVVS